MAYDKTNWVNDETPLNAENMNKIEQGIADSVSQEDFDKLVNNVTQIKNPENPDLLLIGGAEKYMGFTNAGIGIGNNAAVHTNANISIGKNTKSVNFGAIAIGENSNSTNTKSIAIGYNSKSSGSDSIQLGSGTNTTSNSFQIADDNIYKTNTHTLTVQNAEINGTPAYGVLSGTSAPTTTTVGAVGQFYLDTTNKKLYQCMSITTETVDEVDTNVYEWQEVGGGGSSGLYQHNISMVTKFGPYAYASLSIISGDSEAYTTNNLSDKLYELLNNMGFTSSNSVYPCSGAFTYDSSVKKVIIGIYARTALSSPYYICYSPVSDFTDMTIDDKNYSFITDDTASRRDEAVGNIHSVTDNVIEL